MPPSYVVNIQILRFFAALCVTLAHVGIAVEDRFPPAGSSFRMTYPFDWGLGVDVFFIISGFIMYYLMHDRFGKAGAPVTFLKRRFLRIVPLYWLCTTLTLVSIVAAGSLVNNNGLDPLHIAASYLFIPWPRPDGEVFPLLSLGWTLNYEMLFYLVFAVALLFPRRKGLAVLMALFLLLMAAGQVAPENWTILLFWGNSIIGEFLLGVALAAAFLRGIRFPLAVCGLLAAVGLLSAVAFYQTESYQFLPRLITGGLPAILITTGTILAPHAPMRRPYTWLAVGGDASYALYLTHPFSSKITAIVGAKIGLSPLLTFGAGVVVSIAVSFLVYRLFEKPAGSFLNRRLLRPAA